MVTTYPESLRFYTEIMKIGFLAPILQMRKLKFKRVIIIVYLFIAKLYALSNLFDSQASGLNPVRHPVNSYN